MGISTEQREGVNYLPTFSKLQRSKIRSYSISLTGVCLLAPIKVVIGNYLPSSRTLLLRTQMLVSHANIITWDVFLQSLLSCLLGWSFTSKSILRLQPKRFINPGYHYWSCLLCSIPHNILFWLGPSHQQDDCTGFQCAYSIERNYLFM